MVDTLPDYQDDLRILSGVFLVWTWAVVFLRCFVRARIIKAFKADDWLMLAGQCIFTTYLAMVLQAVYYGLGAPDEGEINMVEGMKFFDISIIIYIVTMAVIKCSIAVFLLRIAVEPIYRYILWSAMIVVSLWSLATVFFTIFSCSPVGYQWDGSIPGGHCLSPKSIVAAEQAYSVMGIVSDWLFALIPIPMVWKVQMNWVNKLTVAGLLGLGIFASVATIIRVKYLVGIAAADNLHGPSVDAEIWTIVEVSLSITAASMPTIRPLLRALKVRGFTSSQNGHPSPAVGPGFGSEAHPSRPKPMRDPELDIDCGPPMQSQRDSEHGSDEYMMRNGSVNLTSNAASGSGLGNRI